MKIWTEFGIKNLPDWVIKENLPNNGSGKEWASYLLIEDGGEDYRVIQSSAMEPEDVSFSRDLDWIEPLLKEIYQRGFDAGKEAK